MCKKKASDLNGISHKRRFSKAYLCIQLHCTQHSTTMNEHLHNTKVATNCRKTKLYTLRTLQSSSVVGLWTFRITIIDLTLSSIYHQTIVDAATEMQSPQHQIQSLPNFSRLAEVPPSPPPTSHHHIASVFALVRIDLQHTKRMSLMPLILDQSRIQLSVGGEEAIIKPI